MDRVVMEMVEGRVTPSHDVGFSPGVLAGDSSCCMLPGVIFSAPAVATDMGVYHWWSCSAELDSMLEYVKPLSEEEGNVATPPIIPPRPPVPVFMYIPLHAPSVGRAPPPSLWGLSCRDPDMSYVVASGGVGPPLVSMPTPLSSVLTLSEKVLPPTDEPGQ